MRISMAIVRAEKGSHETHFGVMIFMIGVQRVLFHRGMLSPVGAMAATSVLAYEICQNASNMWSNTISEVIRSSGLRGPR
jgi:hypothetical protein